MPGVLSQPVAMETDSSGEDEEPREPTYMPIVPAGMSTSAPAPQVHMQPDSVYAGILDVVARAQQKPLHPPD